MKNVVFPALLECCKAFAEDLEKQQKGELDSKMVFRWQFFFARLGHKDMAIEFTKANPDYTKKQLKELDRLIAEAEKQAEAEGKACKPTKCATFGCSDEQINGCHKKVFVNADGTPSNSPAYHIREEALEKYKAREEFDDLKEETLEKIASGDTSAHLDERFLDLAAALKSKDSLAYGRLLDELSEMKVKLTAFKEEVNQRSKSISREKKTAIVQEIDLPDQLKPYSEGTDSATSYVNESGHIIAVVKDGEDSYPVQASNFVARIKEVLEFDDGIEKIQQFVIDGILEGSKGLPAITVEAKDFRSMNWVERLWGNLLITSAAKARDIVRETIQRVSKDAPATKVHYTLGWKNIDDKWYYLYSGGSIGADNVLVAEIGELNGYFYQDEYSCKLSRCAEYVQKFLDISKHEVTIPLLAHAFLSVMIEKLKQEEIEPRYLIWLYGTSGSFKTALSLVMMSFFGNFNSPPASFNDTSAALEKKAYLTKDSLLLVDDFYPASSPQEAKSKADIANKLTRKYGDRISRSRSKSNMKLVKDYPPRGNLICTSELLLIGYSTNSRHMGIELRRGDIKQNILTKLQNKKKYLSCFMVHFIRYVAENIMNDTAVTYRQRFQYYRNKSQDNTHHKRFAEAIACLQIGWETLLDFLKHIRHIDKNKHKEYRDEGFAIFQELARRQNDLIQSDDPADKFMAALKELLDTKQIVPVEKDSPSTLNKGAIICYHDEANYYFVPQSTYAVISDFFAKRGDMLNIGEIMLRKMLAQRRYTVESSDGDKHLTRKIKIGMSSIRVMQIPKAVMDEF